MYTEETRIINWKNILKKGLILLLIITIIFLIIWLCTRNNQKKVNVKYDSNSNVIDIDKIKNDNSNEEIIININEEGFGNDNVNNKSFSESFITNYSYFHTTAKDYIEKNSLPENGKTSKFSLKELISKKVLLPTNYNKSTCDINDSYVLVKNDNGIYTLTTKLVCGKESVTTIETLKCSLLCDNCKLELLEYEYKQSYETSETVYSCPKGYTKNGSKCTKTVTDTKDATKVATYSCPTEYKQTGTGENTKCTKDASSTIDATKTTTYSCKDGVLSGTKCVITSKTNATANTTYSCADGALIGNICRIYKTSNHYEYYTTNKGATYGGCTYSGRVGTNYAYYCTKTTYQDVNATANTSYSCSNGTQSGNKCVTTTTVDATKNTTYSCKDGVLSGDKCIISKTETALPKKNNVYTCPTGYQKTGIASDSKCTKSTTNTKDAAKETKTVTKYRYKWSTETSIEGWTKTGKTRKVSSK